MSSSIESESSTRPGTRFVEDSIEASERTPLIGTGDPTSSRSYHPSPTKDAEARPTPLPREFYFCILIMSAEPLCATVIYPFINALVYDTGITKGNQASVGYWAGIIESLFYVGEMASVIVWAKLSDRYGRKPVLLGGLIGLIVAMFTFGSTKVFWVLVVTRTFQGIFNGNIGITKTVIAETTDSTNVAKALGSIPLQWAFGVTIGPFIGGLFARPAVTWPNPFARSRFFVMHPYFLSCAVIGAICFVIFIINLFGLRETAPQHRKGKGHSPSFPSGSSFGSNDRDTLVSQSDVVIASHPDVAPADSEEAPLESDATQVLRAVSASDGAAPRSEPINPNTLNRGTVIGSGNSSSSKKPSIIQTLSSNPQLGILVINHATVAFLDAANLVLLPLMTSSAVELGGLNWTPQLIGIVIGVYGFCNGVFMYLAFPKLVKRFGPRRMFMCSLTSTVLIWPAYVVMNVFARKAADADGSGSEGWMVGVWVVLVVQLICASATYTCYGTMQMLLIATSDLSNMAITNAFAQMGQSLMRAVAPVCATSLFAVTAEKNLAGGTLVYVVLEVVSLFGVVMCTRISKSFDR